MSELCTTLTFGLSCDRLTTTDDCPLGGSDFFGWCRLTNQLVGPAMLHLPVSCFNLTPVPSSMDTSKLLDRRFFRRLLFWSADAVAEMLLLLFLCTSFIDSLPLPDAGTLGAVSSSGSLLISCAEEAREERIDIRSVLEQTIPVDEDGFGGAAEDADAERGT